MGKRGGVGGDGGRVVSETMVDWFVREEKSTEGTVSSRGGGRVE